MEKYYLRRRAERLAYAAARRHEQQQAQPTRIAHCNAWWPLISLPWTCPRCGWQLLGDHDKGESHD